jgi:hypothetical protein
MMGHNGPPAMLHDVKIKRVCSYGRLRLKSVPPEHFLIDANATVLDEDNCRFVAHITYPTRSQLLKDYPDKADLIRSLPASTRTPLDDSTSLAREDLNLNLRSETTDKSTELVEVFECYVQVDYDGDGVAEWRKVVTGDRTVDGSADSGFLENEEWGDMLPFSDIVPNPQPHRWRGAGIFDEMEDVQKVKTVLIRGVQDQTYWLNNPQRNVVEGQVVNMDQLINPDFGGVVITRGPGAIADMPIPFTADKIMPFVDYWDKIGEKRTGVVQGGPALDMDALANQTAKAVQSVETAQFSRIEEYARNIAECGGLQRVFKCILKLVVKHQDRPRMIKLRDEWVEMDPRGWNANMAVVINTGLGTGSRDRDMQVMQGMAMKLEQFIQLAGPMASHQLGVGPDTLFSLYRKMAEASGIKRPDQWFPEISQEDIENVLKGMGQQKPDPKMMEVQAKMQLEQAKAQTEAAMMQAKHQAEQDRAAQDFEAERQKAVMQAAITEKQAQADLQREQQIAERQAMLEEKQAEADIAVKQRESEMRMMLERQKAESQHTLEHAKIEAQRALEQMKFEFASKLKVLELGFKARADMQQNASAQAGVMVSPPAISDDMQGMLSEHGVDLPELAAPKPAPIELALQQLAQGQAQLTQHLANQSAMMAAPPKPKKFAFHRDPATNRIIGAETLQ